MCLLPTLQQLWAAIVLLAIQRLLAKMRLKQARLIVAMTLLLLLLLLMMMMIIPPKERGSKHEAYDAICKISEKKVQSVSADGSFT
mmetsp:Transcript_13041/g.15475  ORF Transcript_13041/g.15475 Transcript_13041/m.15475 type:complete len:86 (+) Transcript_13041:425-682(+)